MFHLGNSYDIIHIQNCSRKYPYPAQGELLGIESQNVLREVWTKTVMWRGMGGILAIVKKNQFGQVSLASRWPTVGQQSADNIFWELFFTITGISLVWIFFHVESWLSGEGVMTLRWNFAFKTRWKLLFYSFLCPVSHSFHARSSINYYILEIEKASTLTRKLHSKVVQSMIGQELPERK